jgi:zinc/manganese transport system permease protein
MLGHEFMRNAFLAGTPIALACGLVGCFVVLRAQVFAGDALSHVAFAGALAAAAFGIDIRLGLFAATIAVAVGMGELGDRARADDVVIGSVFAWILGLGALFLSIFTSDASGTTSGTAGVRVLFGSIFGLSVADARLAAGIALGACVAVLAIARPLLFASLDPDVAAARGVPVRALGLGFLAILGVVAAEATQAVGALLLLGLLAAPAGAASFLTVRPYARLALSGALSVASAWIGLSLSYAIGSLPPSSAIIMTAVAIYAAAAFRARIGIRQASVQPERPRA